jgi:hypothetical protein
MFRKGSCIFLFKTHFPGQVEIRKRACKERKRINRSHEVIGSKDRNIELQTK